MAGSLIYADLGLGRGANSGDTEEESLRPFSETKCFVTTPTASTRLGPNCPVSDYTGRVVRAPCALVYKALMDERNPPKAPEYKYLGCYRDKRSSRAFPNKAWNAKLTLEKCINFAKSPPKSYRDQTVKPTQPAHFLGMQFGEQG